LDADSILFHFPAGILKHPFPERTEKPFPEEVISRQALTFSESVKSNGAILQGMVTSE
jgi:hypothetical protein